MRSDAVFTADVESRNSQKRKVDTENTDLQEYDSMLNSLEKVHKFFRRNTFDLFTPASTKMFVFLL